MHNLWFTVVVITCGLRVSSDVIENLKLHEVFRKPKDFSRVNFDHLEILEKNNYEPILANHEHEESSAHSKLHPKSVANAQVMLRFGGDDIKGRNSINKNPSPDLTTRFGVPCCQHCQQPHYQIVNQYKPPYQFMPPYALGQYPVPAYIPLALPPNPYYPYYCPCFNNVPGMIPNDSSSAHNCPFLGGNLQTNIASVKNVNHPKILQATDLTDEIVPENNDAKIDDDPIIIPDLEDTFKIPKGYKDPPLSKFEKDYKKRLGPGVENKPKPPHGDDNYEMDDEPIIIPDLEDTFKIPKGYTDPPLSKFEKDHIKELGPGAENKPKPPHGDDNYEIDDEPIIIPDLEDTFKRPKGYKDPLLSKFEKDYKKRLGPGVENKPKPPHGDDNYEMDDEPIIIPDLEDTFKRPKGYTDPPLSKFEKDYKKRLGPGVENKPKPIHGDDETEMDDEPIIIPDLEDTFKRPEGYTDPPLSKFEKDYIKSLRSGAAKKSKPPHGNDNYEMDDEPIIIPDLEDTFKRPKGYKDPPLSKFEKDHIKELGPGAENKPKPKPPQGDDNYEMDDEPIIIPDLEDTFKRPKGYTDPPLSKFEKDYKKRLGPGVENKPKPKPPHGDDNYEMDDEPIVIPDLEDTFKRPKGYKDPLLSKFEKDYKKRLGPGVENKPKPPHGDDNYEIDDEPIIIPDLEDTFKRPKGYKDPLLSKFEKDYKKRLGPGVENKPKPPHGDDNYEMDDEPIIIPDLEDTFKRPKGYTDPPLSKFEKDYKKRLGPGVENKPKPIHGDDETEMDDEPIIIPDLEDTFKRPEGYTDPPLSKFEKDYIKSLRSGAAKKSKPPHGNDNYEMDDEPIIIPDLEDTFKRPKGYKDPPLSKFEKDHIKELGPGAENKPKPKPPQGDDNYEMDDEPIIIPDLEDTFKRPKGYTDPPLSKFEKDYKKRLGPGVENKPKPKPPHGDDNYEMDDEPIIIPDLEDTFKRPEGYTDPPLSKFEKDYIKSLRSGAAKKSKPPHGNDNYEMDDEPIVIPDLEDTFKRPKGYKDPPLSKFEKDYKKRLGPVVENKPKPKPPHGDDNYEMDDEPIIIPDLEDTFKRPKGYTDPPLSKFEKDHIKELGPGAENKPKPKPPQGDDNYEIDDEPIIIPDLEDTFKRPKGYKDPPLSKFEKDHIKELGPGAENKPKPKPPHGDDNYEMNDEPIIIPDLEDTFKRPKGYKDPPLSKFEKDYKKRLGPGVENKPKPKPPHGDDNYEMDDEPIIIPDLEDTFKRPKGYTDPPLSKFEKDHIKELGPGAENKPKPKPPQGDDNYEIDDEPIIIPDLEDTFKRPKGYKDPPLSKFEKDHIKELGPGAENKPKPKPPHGDDNYEMNDEPIIIPDLEDTFKRPKGYKDPPLSKFEKDYKKRLGPGVENKPKPKPPHGDDNYEMDDEPIIIPDLEDTFKRPKGYTDPPLSKFEKDHIKELGPGAENKPKPKPPHGDDNYEMNDEPIIIPDLEDTFKRPKGYKDPPLSKFEKDYKKRLGPGVENKPKPIHGDDNYEMDDEPIIIPDLENTFKRPEGYTDPPLSKFEKDYIKSLRSGAAKKSKPPHGDDNYEMDDEPIIIPDLEDTFKRPKGYTDPPLSKFEKNYKKRLGPGVENKPKPIHGDDETEMDDEPIIIPDLEDTFKIPKGYKDPPLSKFEKDYIKKLGPGAENKPKPKPPHGDDNYEMDDEPITIPDLEDTFKRPEGYTDPPLSKFEKDYIKSLRSGAAKKSKPTCGGDDTKINDEPITIPDLEDTFKRPKGYKDPPLSKFEKDYLKQLEEGSANKPKPKPIIKNAVKPCAIAKKGGKGRKGNDKNKTKCNKRGKVQTKRGNKPIPIKPPTKKDNLDARSIKEEKPVFDSTVMKDKPVFEETIKTESPINTHRKMEECMFDQSIKSEEPLDTAPIKEINDEIFRQKIPLPDCECDQLKKSHSVRRELEDWLNKSLVPFDCDKCGRKLLVSYPITDEQNTHCADAPLMPSSCPCCQLKGFCDCKNCQCHRDPSIPYGQRFSADIDSLVKMAGDNWAPGGYYSDPYRKILFKPPTVFNFITHSNPAGGVQGACGIEEPQMYKVVPKYQIVPKEVKPLGLPKLIPTETFVCCKVPGNRMLCQRQYIAGNQPVLIEKEEV